MVSPTLYPAFAPPLHLVHHPLSPFGSSAVVASRASRYTSLALSVRAWPYTGTASLLPLSDLSPHISPENSQHQSILRQTPTSLHSNTPVQPQPQPNHKAPFASTPQPATQHPHPTADPRISHAHHTDNSPIPHHHSQQRLKHTRPAAIITTAVATALALILSPILPVAAAPSNPRRTTAQKNPVITITDQVPDFALPSRTRNNQQYKKHLRNPNNSLSSLVHTAVHVVVHKVAPAITIIGLAAWIVSNFLRRAQEKQLRDFQSQLKNLSSMLDLDAASLSSAPTNSSSDGDATNPTTARSFSNLANNSKRYKMRTSEQEAEADNLAAKVRLDLFQQKSPIADNPNQIANSNNKARPASQPATVVADHDIPTATPPRQGKPVDQVPASTSKLSSEGSKVHTPAPSSTYEVAVLAALHEVCQGLTSPIGAGASLTAARASANPPMSVDDAKLSFNTYASKFVSAYIDAAADIVQLAQNSSTSLSDVANPQIAEKALVKFQDLVKVMRAISQVAEAAGLVIGLAYVGEFAGKETMREDIYRSYAVFLLSDEARLRDEMALQGLQDMQKLLALSGQRTEAINRDIAKGMFQVAASAAMVDGSVSPQDKRALEELKVTLGDLLDVDAADNIMSEVSVMRAMYSLQDLLQNQSVNENDIAELRKMCADLGVDIDEMMRNAAAMGDSLGPEVKQFVVGLRALLSEDKATITDSIGSLMANTALGVAPEGTFDSPSKSVTENDLPESDGPDVAQN